ncbi:MAG: hypothetical protein M3P23_14550, partial [Actinomycetota bacterium]|nr:hypothetical protein [Actinomycetota bacterium]
MRQTVAEQLVDTPGGVDLARLIALAGADLDVLTDAERLELVKATARQDAWTASVRAQAIAAVYDSARAEMAAEAAELARALARALAQPGSEPGSEPGSGALPAQRGKQRSGRVGLAGLSHGFDELR